MAGLGPAATPEVIEAMKKINPKGSVRENQRRDGSYKYYLSEPIRDNDAKGVGPFIWASLEMEMLGYTTDNITASIDREAVLFRNSPIITQADPLTSLTVGNGHFATTVDVTGLQSYVEEYSNGIPLNAMSDWGWHSFPNKDNLKPEESEKSYDFGHGHKEVYAVEYKKAEDGRHKLATEYFRVNPHRLNLGAVGLELKDANGRCIPLQGITDIHQQQNLWQGEITSSYKADGQKVNVTTIGLPDRDAVAYRISSPLLQKGQAAVSIRLPYPTGKHADDASDWSKDASHQSRIGLQQGNTAIIEHSLDTTTYYIYIRWEGQAQLQEVKAHTYQLCTSTDALAFEVEYSPENRASALEAFRFDTAQKTTQKFWHKFWTETAFVDFGLCTDPRAKELERRVVLSQYLTRINCANNMPPQETGLTYNTWFGRPHLEMTWWHAVDFALWNQPKVVEQMLRWYDGVAAPIAKKIAQRQGFKGIRWMKMTDPLAGEAPSNTGSFLTWQQPHYIYLAEEMYRANPSSETLKKYAENVEATAEFLADFGKTGKLFGQTAMQECMTKDISYNHPFELAYFRYALNVAQQWRERMGKPRNKQWDDVIARLNPLPVTKEGIYTAGLPIGKTEGLQSFDPFNTVGGGATTTKAETFAEKIRNDHPAVLGAFGLLPQDASHFDSAKAKKTLDWVMQHWNWQTTWGWDYGMIAMTAARLGRPNIALDALLIDTQKNTYLKNGHNFQTADRLRLYLPGNGALLTAIAMMCAGWDGCQEVLNPGFPKDGKWNVRWEGLHRMQ